MQNSFEWAFQIQTTFAALNMHKLDFKCSYVVTDCLHALLIKFMMHCYNVQEKGTATKQER